MSAKSTTAKTTTANASQDRFVYQDDEMMEKSFDWGQMRRLAVYVKPYAAKLLPVVGLMMVLGTVTKLAIPLLIGLAIDRAIDVFPTPGGPTRHKIGPFIFLTSFCTAKYSSTRSLGFSRP